MYRAPKVISAFLDRMEKRRKYDIHMKSVTTVKPSIDQTPPPPCPRLVIYERRRRRELEEQKKIDDIHIAEIKKRYEKRFGLRDIKENYSASSKEDFIEIGYEDGLSVVDIKPSRTTRNIIRAPITRPYVKTGKNKTPNTVRNLRERFMPIRVPAKSPNGINPRMKIRPPEEKKERMGVSNLPMERPIDDKGFHYIAEVESKVENEHSTFDEYEDKHDNYDQNVPMSDSGPYDDGEDQSDDNNQHIQTHDAGYYDERADHSGHDDEFEKTNSDHIKGTSNEQTNTHELSEKSESKEDDFESISGDSDFDKTDELDLDRNGDKEISHERDPVNEENGNGDYEKSLNETKTNDFEYDFNSEGDEYKGKGDNDFDNTDHFSERDNDEVTNPSNKKDGIEDGDNHFQDDCSNDADDPSHANYQGELLGKVVKNDEGFERVPSENKSVDGDENQQPENYNRFENDHRSQCENDDFMNDGDGSDGDLDLGPLMPSVLKKNMNNYDF